MFVTEEAVDPEAASCDGTLTAGIFDCTFDTIGVVADDCDEMEREELANSETCFAGTFPPCPAVCT